MSRAEWIGGIAELLPPAVGNTKQDVRNMSARITNEPRVKILTDDASTKIMTMSAMLATCTIGIKVRHKTRWYSNPTVNAASFDSAYKLEMVQCVIEPAATMARRIVRGEIVAGIDMLAGVSVASTDTNDLSNVSQLVNLKACMIAMQRP